MAGSSLMLLHPERFATAQRMAQAFASSDMVPEQLKGSMQNCLVALMLADEMGESPLMVMQNIFFVGGRAGWQTQYMIARANRCGAFKGPLTWKVEGEGAGLAATCSATLRLNDGSAGERIEITVTMAMAKADGWTRNKKYESIPEQMLRWRSAAWLIRLHCPEVMFGLPTADELEDTMRDVTPAPLRPDDFKPSGGRDAPHLPAARRQVPARRQPSESDQEILDRLEAGRAVPALVIEPDPLPDQLAEAISGAFKNLPQGTADRGARGGSDESPAAAAAHYDITTGKDETNVDER
jgi:hypothetical protein